MIPQPELGQKIRESRKAMGLTMLQFARKIDISPSMVWFYEGGGAVPRLEKYVRICRVLDLDKVFIPRALPEEQTAWDDLKTPINFKDLLNWRLKYQEELKLIPKKDI